MPFPRICACKCANGFRAPIVDIAEQMALDLIVDGRSEEGRIKALKANAASRRGNSVLLLSGGLIG
jgi:hypothetical protein